MALRIVVFCAYFYPHEGGVEKYVYELFKDLKNTSVTIITCNTENVKFHEKRSGFDIYRLDCWNMVNGNYPVLTPYGIRQLRGLKEVFDNDIDWIVTNTRFFNISFFGSLMAKKYKIKHLHIEHGTSHSKQGNVFVGMINVLYDHTFGRYVIKNADIVAGVSKAAQQFSNHIYTRQSSLLPNCIDVSRFKKISGAKQLKLKRFLKLGDEKVLTFVGRAIKAKGIQDFLEAARGIDKKGIDNIKILIIGDGNYLGELKKSAERLGFDDKKCIFLGQKNIDEIIAYLSITDIFINPSYTEGLPTSVLEAGAMGLPIIATDVGGTREIIDDGKNGYLIAAHDIDALRQRIEKLLSDRKLVKKFSLNIKSKIVNDYDVAMIRKKLINILSQDKT